MKTIYYSFIIPHKNSYELLDRCLNSIPKREDIQIIIIDDNSENITKLKGIAIKHSQVELYLTKENKGAGYARNVGLSKVKGKWIVFADSDDFFNDKLNLYLDKYKKSNYDIIFFDSNSVFSETLEKTESRCLYLKEGIRDRDLEKLKYGVTVVWSKFYNSNLIFQNQIYFDETIASNDVMFATKASYYAQNIHIDDYNLYCSTINLSSLSYKFTIPNLDSRFHVGMTRNSFLEQIGITKYRTNILSNTLYYHIFGYNILFQALLRYIKIVPLRWKIKDLTRSVKRYVKNGNKKRKLIHENNK